MTASVQRYLGLISEYEREFKKWEGRVEKILKRYKDEYRNGTRGYTEARFNVLWSNVNTIVPAVYAKLPKPDVSRRFKDNDPVGRVAALILERALEFEVEHYSDYRSAMKNSVYDRFLGGRGVSWVRYEPHFTTAPDMPEDGLQVTEDVEEEESPESKEYTEGAEVIETECAPIDYVHWKDFGHEIARTWEEVGVVWRKVYMKRPALVERFGEEIGNKIPLDTKPEEMKKAQWGDTGDYEACIYEMWDKSADVALWIHKSMPEVLDEREDPLELESFFPCPKPLYATLTSDSLVPTPDFSLYQDQANELDILSDRIDGLIKALQVKGVYDASIPELARLFTEAENNTLIPVKSWQAFSEKNGLKGAIDLVDITPIASALVEAYKAMEQVKNQIYEITGLSDIVRGQTAASETATAQQIKGQYASLRLKSMQTDVAEFAATLMRLKAQIICKFFQPETIIKISAAEQLNEADKQYVGPAIELLKSSELSAFRVEIAVDSLIQIDEEGEKQSRMEFLTATGGFLKEALPIVQSSPEIAPLLLELMKFGVSAFKVGKTVEGVFDQAAEQIKKAAAMPRQTPPDPEMVKAQAAQQLEQFRAQTTMQTQAAQQQHEGQLETVRMQQAAQLEQFRAQLTQQNEQQRAQFDMQMEQARLQQAAMLAQINDSFNRWKVETESRTKIEIAELSANTTLQMEQAKAATEASKAQAVTNDSEALKSSIDELKQLVTRPKKIIRGPDNRISGVE